MTKSEINRLLCSGLIFLFAGCTGSAAFAQQAKPVSGKTASSKTGSSCDASCSKKAMACCKGTPTRAAVLAVNAAKTKPVKN